MINRFFFLFSSLVFLIGNTASAIASDSLLTHTQHTPIELKPASFDNLYKYASVCFLGSGNACGDGSYNKGNDNYEVSAETRCLEEGYKLTSCSIPLYPYNFCPYDSSYFKECKEDTDKACLDAGYVNNCPEGDILDDTQTCPYNDSYQKCKCNPCEGYNYTYEEATSEGYVTGAGCNSCGTMKYQRLNAPCNGFFSCECSGEIGAQSCKSGTSTLFSQCKECCENRCRLEKCPDNHICDFEVCSQKYCENGCEFGYIWKNGNCEIDKSCLIGRIYYMDGTCSAPSAYTTDKQALGIVIYVNPNSTGGQLMSAKSLGKYKWGITGIDVANLPNATFYLPTTDFSSCENTDKIMAEGDSSIYEAAWATRDYAPTIETKGKWCLPAAGIMHNLYSNLSTINEAIGKLNGVKIGSNDIIYLWSSTEYGLDGTWSFRMRESTHGLKPELKDKDYDVYPVLEF